MYSRDGIMMSTPPEYIEKDSGYTYTHVNTELLEAILNLVGKENLLINSINKRETVYPSRVVYSISEKISEVVELLKRSGEMSVKALFQTSKSRTEVIATFVAVLELCKVGSVIISGIEEDMMIEYTNSGQHAEIVDFTAEVYDGEA